VLQCVAVCCSVLHINNCRVHFVYTVTPNSQQIQGGVESQDALPLQVIFHKRARGARRRSAVARCCHAPTGSDQSNKDCSNRGVYSNSGVSYLNTLPYLISK